MKIRWDIVILTFFITSLVVGFFLTVQLRVFGSKGALEALSMSDLTTLYNDLNTEVIELKAYVQELKIRANEYSSITGNRERLLKTMKEEIEMLRVISGAASVEGKGVEVTVFDDKNNLQSLDLIDLVNELRAAGAIAISVNNIRIIFNSSFLKTNQGFIIDGIAIGAPYTVSAIGDPETLYSSLTFPGGVAKSIDAIEGVSVSVVKKDSIFISSKKSAKSKN
ncbi:MAG: DUF881 domain-containing protein [Actinobacteria bacterium]|nr:DUF881 domain-containing protein [Actinomycetota bacterium]